MIDCVHGSQFLAGHVAPCATPGCPRGYSGPDYVTAEIPRLQPSFTEPDIPMSSVHVEKTIWVRALFRVGRQLPAREEWRWITSAEDAKHRAEHAAAYTPEASARFWRTLAEMQRDAD